MGKITPPDTAERKFTPEELLQSLRSDILKCLDKKIQITQAILDVGTRTEYVEIEPLEVIRVVCDVYRPRNPASTENVAPLALALLTNKRLKDKKSEDLLPRKLKHEQRRSLGTR